MGRFLPGKPRSGHRRLDGSHADDDRERSRGQRRRRLDGRSALNSGAGRPQGCDGSFEADIVPAANRSRPFLLRRSPDDPRDCRAGRGDRIRRRERQRHAGSDRGHDRDFPGEGW